MDDDNFPPDSGMDKGEARLIKQRKQCPKAMKEAFWNVIVSKKVETTIQRHCQNSNNF
jgi:hypothetical protein